MPLIDAVVTAVHHQHLVAVLEDSTGRRYIINANTRGVDVLKLRVDQAVCCDVTDIGLVERAIADLPKIQRVSVAKLSEISTAAARTADLRHHAAGRLATPGDDDSVPAAIREVQAVIWAVIPEFQLVKILSEDGSTFAITPKTPGVKFASLRKGQILRCTVTIRPPRVLRAEVIS